MDSNLLVTKIIVPSKRNDVLQRRRLLDFMHEYIGRKLLLVSANAGYGKTSLLVDFAHDTELPVCWYSLDAADRDPRVFLEYLVAAIQRRFPHFGGRTTALLRSTGDNRTTDTYIGSLVTEIYEQIDSLFVIVLEDYQLVEDSHPLSVLLDRLLTVLPENAHLILSSRTLPGQLNLTRLTAQQQVTGLGTGDLRFTADEIRAWVKQNYTLEISPTIAEELATQSEGWITGIVLTTPTLWRGLVQQWVKGDGPGSQLFEYLAQQVLLEQPNELQQFLLDTAVLGEMTGALCNELLGRTDADALFQLAENRNLFVTRLGESGYRYHHLFRDFLQSRLRQTQPTRWTHLLEKAAALFERHNKPDQAVEHWLAAENWDQAARILTTLAEPYYQLGRWTTLTRWLDTLQNHIQPEPELLLWRALLGAEAGEMELARRTFAGAETEFAQRGETVKLARVLIESARHDEIIARGIEKCQRALGILPAHEYQLHALGNRTMGILTSRTGDNAGAIALLVRAIELAERANNRYLQSETESDLGGVNLMLGNRREAEIHFQNARTYWERLGNASKLANALNNIAVLRYQQGELARALELLLEAQKQSHQSGYLRVEGYALAGLGDVFRDQGKFAEALDAYMSAAALASKVHEGFLTIFCHVAAADIWRMTGEYATAEQLLNATLNTATLHDSDYEVALVQMGLGALALTQHETKAGVRQLEYALPLLEQANAKRDVARTHFFLARAAVERKQTAAAVQHLRAAAALGTELDEDQFLWSEVVHAPFVLDFALAHKAGLTYFRRIEKKLAQNPQTRSPLEITTLEPTFPELQLFAFGEPRVLLDGELIQKSAWKTNTTQDLFFFFALNPQGWRKEQVVAQLWGEAQRGQASDLFHASVYRIRRALFHECLLFQNGIYQLNPEITHRLDVEEFEQALAVAQQAQEVDEKRGALEQAVELYQGELMNDSYTDWFVHRREELRTRYLDALVQLAHLNANIGDWSRALELYQQALVTDPAHEETYRGLMELYAAQGNRAAVVQTYQQCVDNLNRELGVLPMEETTNIYRRLVR